MISHWCEPRPLQATPSLQKYQLRHLVEHRLQHSYSMLTDRRSLHLGIIDIAFAAGFGDVSHFNRMFRRRFGDTPSGVLLPPSGATRTELKSYQLRGEVNRS
jgi:AraC-like DNA-binding protein